MNYTLDKQEHHSLVKPSFEKLDGDTGKLFKTALLKDIAEANKFVIINMSSVFLATDEGYIVLKEIEKNLRDANGMLILTELNDNIFQALKDSDFTLIPTDVEAVDFAFMDQLERQFLDPENN